MPKSYPIRDVIKIVNVEREAFKAWAHRKYVEPSVYKAKGPGEQSLYDLYDLYAIKLFSYLVSSNWPRFDASLRVKDFLSYIRKRGVKDAETIYIALLRRPIGKDKMLRKSGPRFTDTGRLISKKALAPGVRVLVPEDLEKSFKTLFLTFDDTDIPKNFDLKDVELENVTIINFSDLKRRVDMAVKEIE
jgi:hypothetical protein